MRLKFHFQKVNFMLGENHSCTETTWKGGTYIPNLAGQQHQLSWMNKFKELKDFLFFGIMDNTLKNTSRSICFRIGDSNLFGQICVQVITGMLTYSSLNLILENVKSFLYEQIDQYHRIKTLHRAPIIFSCNSFERKLLLYIISRSMISFYFIFGRLLLNLMPNVGSREF